LFFKGLNPFHHHISMNTGTKICAYSCVQYVILLKAETPRSVIHSRILLTVVVINCSFSYIFAYVSQWGVTLNPLNAELNPICYLLALLGVHHFLHVSRIRVKSLTLRLLMSYSYIYIYMEHLFLIIPLFLDCSTCFERYYRSLSRASKL